MERRDFLKLAGLAGTALALDAPTLSRVFADSPGTFQPAQRDPISHVISRLTFGVTPALYEHVKSIGVDAFIEEQLAYLQIDDTDVNLMLSSEFPLIEMESNEAFDRYRGMQGQLFRQLIGANIVRGQLSKRQLFERVVQFWTDHFNVYLLKNPVAFFKATDERDVIRKHSMGKFRDLLGASAHSPAMLVYLDNAQSEASHPNENYARELMELHTLGVNGGYTEDDVVAVARAFTGWSIVPPRGSDSARTSGTFVFRRMIHDYEDKVVLGQLLAPNDGEGDGEQVLDMLASHPSTAHYISTKLVRRFVSDFPPDSLVQQVAQTFTDTDGDIPSILRVIFYSDEFHNAPPKFKRPYEFAIGLIRGLDYQVTRTNRFYRGLFETFEALGHIPYFWPAPNGYPDVGAYWMNNLLPRWNLVVEMLSGGLGEPNGEAFSNLIGANVTTDSDEAVLSFLAQYFLGRPITDSESTVVWDFVDSIGATDDARWLAAVQLMLASPAYQYK